jgi:DNA-binding transcriptional regulator YhcF (GntR family)
MKNKWSSGDENGDYAIPQYVHLANKIIRKIRNGGYSPGEKLKGMRALAKEYGVSFQVVISAMQQLSYKGFVIPEPKRGNFINPAKHGRYYQIGVFVNRYNPSASAHIISQLYREAQRCGYGLMQGSNYDENFSLGRWVARKKEIDGLIVIGVIKDKNLDPLQKGKLPYLVMGNHEISEKHPQLIIPVADNLCKNLYPHLTPFKGKRIAALVGTKASRSDREAMDGIRNAIRKAGGDLDEKLLLFAEYGGLKEVTMLMEKFKPDVLYLHGLHREYARYCNSHPQLKRPFLICTPNSIYLRPDEIDDEIEDCDHDSEDARTAIEMLVKEIDTLHPEKERFWTNAQKQHKNNGKHI